MKVILTGTKKASPTLNYRRLDIWVKLHCAVLCAGFFAFPALYYYICVRKIQINAIREAKIQIDAMNRNQQNYYATTEAFTDSFTDLDLPIAPQTPDYHYSILVTRSLVLNYAIPRKPGLKGYVGAVFKTQWDDSQKSSKFTVTLACEALELGTNPKLPVLKENWLECAPKSRQFNDRSYDTGYLIRESFRNELERNLTDFRTYWRAKTWEKLGARNSAGIAQSIDFDYLKARTLIELGSLEEGVRAALALDRHHHYETLFWKKVAPQLITSKPLKPEVAKVLSNRYIKARALLALEQIDLTLEILPNLSDRENRQRILKNISAKVSVDRSLEIARSLSEENRAFLLNSVVEKPLSIAQVDRLLEGVTTLPENDIAMVLSRLTPKLKTKNQVDLFLKTAQTAKYDTASEDASAYLLRIVIPKLATVEQIDLAFELAEIIPHGYAKQVFLEEISPFLIEERQINRLLQMLEYSGGREIANAIVTLAPRFTTDWQYRQSQKLALRIVHPVRKIGALVDARAYNLALQMGVGEGFLAIVSEINTASQVDLALSKIQNNNLYCRHYAAVPKYCMVLFFEKITPKFTTFSQRKKAFQIASNLKDEYTKGKAFLELGSLDRAIEIIPRISEQDTHDRQENLKIFLEEIAPKLETPEQFDRVIKISQNLETHEIDILKRIAPYLKTEEQRQRVLKKSKKFNTYNQALILIALGKTDRALAITEHLNSDYAKADIFAAAGQSDRVLAIYKTISEDYRKRNFEDDVVSTLISIRRYEQVLEFIKIIDSGWDIYTATLKKILPHVKTANKVDYFLDATQAIKDNNHKYSALATILPKLTTMKQVDRVLDIARMMIQDNSNSGDSSRVLTAIAPKLKTQAQFDRALEIARSLEDEKESRIAIAAIQFAQKYQ